MVMGWVVFSGSLPSLGTRRCALSVGIRSRIARLAGLYGGSCTPNAVPSLRVSPCNTTATHPAAPLGSRSGAARWEFSVGQQEGDGEEIRDEEVASGWDA